MIIGNLFLKPVATNVHMLKLGYEGWKIFHEQVNCLLVVAMDGNFVAEIKSKILKDPIPPKGFRCCM